MRTFLAACTLAFAAREALSANSKGSQLALRTAAGSGLVIVEASDFLFRMGPVGKMSYGASVNMSNSGASADIRFQSGDDGDEFLLVSYADGRPGACVLDVNANPYDLVVKAFQRDGLACAPKLVEAGLWEVDASATTSSCDYYSEPCDDASRLQLRVAQGSGLVLEVAKDLLFGRGPVGDMAYGADVNIGAAGTSAEVHFWLDDDGDAFLKVQYADGRPGACVLDVDSNKENPVLKVFQRDGLACTPKLVAADLWELELSGSASSCDGYESLCDGKVKNLAVQTVIV